MKPLLLITVLLIFFLKSTSSQVVDTTHQNLTYHEKMYMDYMKKSKDKRTAGFILLGAGSGLFVWGSALVSNNLFIDSNAGVFQFVLGSIAVIASIPILISAGNNKKQAQFYLGTQATSHIPIPNLPVQIPSVGFKMDLQGK